VVVGISVGNGHSDARYASLSHEIKQCASKRPRLNLASKKRGDRMPPHRSWSIVLYDRDGNTSFVFILELHVVDHKIRIRGLLSIIDDTESCVAKIILSSASSVGLGHDDRSRYWEFQFLDSPSFFPRHSSNRRMALLLRGPCCSNLEFALPRIFIVSKSWPGCQPIEADVYIRKFVLSHTGEVGW